MSPAPDADTGRRRLRIAVVVQRYGLEINGGAELHARVFVEALRTRHAVTVLTTRAKDYTRWDRHYAAGTDSVDGTPVLRFDHPERGHSGRARLPRLHLVRYRLGGWLSRMGATRVARPDGHPDHDGETYLERQGPFCPDLVDHLRDGSDRYDVVVFFTALYHPTAVGLRACPLPSVLVPTLHNERSMSLPLFHDVFRKPSWILWNCQAEQRLAQRLYGADIAPGSVCGVGITLPEILPSACEAALARHGVVGPYVVFVGRVTRSKGFHVLARAFRQLRALGGPRCQLVVIGQRFMKELPQAADIVYAGFVDDAERDALIARAAATVVTSRHESLSLVTLESMALGTPVIVNGRSDVLRAHIDDSGAGWVYGFGHPLALALRTALRLPPERRAALGDAGRRYVREHYAAARVRQVLFDAVEGVAK